MTAFAMNKIDLTAEPRTIVTNEPSAELQCLANTYLESQQHHSLHRADLMSHWCEFLSTKSPELLDLPVMQLMKAIVRASLQQEKLLVLSEH